MGKPGRLDLEPAQGRERARPTGRPCVRRFEVKRVAYVGSWAGSARKRCLCARQRPNMRVRAYLANS